MTIVVAEIGNNHDGSLGNCHSFIDACANAGADAIKFQCHQGNPWKEFPKRFAFHPQDATRQEYVSRMKFTAQQWAGLRDHVKQRGKTFIVSCFSKAGVDFMDVCDRKPDMWKIPSGMAHGDVDYYRAITTKKQPFIVSTGMMATKPAPAPFILQCTTQYPTPFERVGLNLLKGNCNGLSDHSGTIYPSLAAAALGAEMVEVHVCWDKRQFGCDVRASISVDELCTLCEGVRATETMLANPVDKAKVLEELGDDVACYAGLDRRPYKDGKPQFD